MSMLRPLLLHLDPERAHGLTIAMLRTGLGGSAALPPASLAIRVAGLDFASPIGLAAGFDKNAEVPDAMLRRGFGFSWNIGGWLLFRALQRLDPAAVQRMRKRVADEMTTTFASHYTARIPLEQVLEPETVAAYVRKSTGEKYLITP